MRVASLLAALIVILLLVLRGVAPPAPRPVSAPPTDFSTARALPDVRIIAQRPHPTGSVASMRARDYLVHRLAGLGLSPVARAYLIDPHALDVLRRRSDGVLSPSELVDVIGVLPGRDRALPAIALMAHYDTVWGSPGGTDDTLGIATILEVVRALKARGPLRRDVVVLFTDAEEVGLSGARAFWSGDPLASHVGVVINLESRGASGRALMFETGAGNGPMIDLFATSVPHPRANSLSVLAYQHMPNRTDFTPVRAQGMSGFNFATLGGAQYYHSPLATYDCLDPASLQDMGEQALALTAALGSAGTLPAKGEDAAFFAPTGHGLLVYKAAKGWWWVVASVALLGAAWAGARRGKHVTVRALGEGFVALVWLLSHALLAVAAFNRLSGSGSHPNYYDRLAALPRLEAQTILLCFAALAGWLTLMRWRPRIAGLLPALVLIVGGLALGVPVKMVLAAGIAAMLAGWFTPAGGVSRWGGWFAAIGLLLLLAVATQVTLPLTGWLFGWPALVFSMAAAIVAWSDPAMRRPWSPVVQAVAAILVCPAVLMLGHEVFLALGAPMPEALLALLPILAAAFWPLARAPGWAKSVGVVALAAVVAAGTLAVQVRTDPIADTVPPYSDGK